MEALKIQSAPQTNHLQLGKMDPADLITSWLHFNNSAFNDLHVLPDEKSLNTKSIIDFLIPFSKVFLF